MAHHHHAGVASRARQSPYPMLPMPEALDIVRNACSLLPTVTLPTLEAIGHVLAEDVYALEPVPPFRASVVDGYAVIASDGPGDFPLIPAVVAGAASNQPLQPGKICRVTTGAPVPDGADAVVMVENTELVEGDASGEERVVRIKVGATLGENIRPIGCDIAQGEKIAAGGDLITAAEIGTLVSVGIQQVLVHRKPVVAILSTGNELVDLVDSVPHTQQIRDTNRPVLQALLEAEHATVIDLGIAKDSFEAILERVKDGLTRADMLITTGGVSMGELDLLKPILKALNATVHFGRLMMKPGKPTTFATIPAPAHNDTFGNHPRMIFSLPGNPVSAVVTYYLFVLPSLRRMSGVAAQYQDLPRISVTLRQSMKLDPRPEYARAFVAIYPDPPFLRADITGRQMSSRLMSMRKANCLLELPGRTESLTEMPAGSVVNALLIGQIGVAGAE